MKLFVALSLVATAACAALTYHPVRVCERVNTTISVDCTDHYCTATTINSTPICHWSHM
jgi:hypothetical protein